MTVVPQSTAATATAATRRSPTLELDEHYALKNFWGEPWEVITFFRIFKYLWLIWNEHSKPKFSTCPSCISECCTCCRWLLSWPLTCVQWLPNTGVFKLWSVSDKGLEDTELSEHTIYIVPNVFSVVSWFLVLEHYHSVLHDRSSTKLDERRESSVLKFASYL